jgi:CheY-like chemotaxis protein
VTTSPSGNDLETRTTILVIDDDDDIREVLATLLDEAGFRVVTAANGREALEHLREDPQPDVILLDLMMPEMDGYQFRAEQQRDPALRAIPTLIVTAGTVTSRVEALGAEAILRKPVSLRRLVDTIRRFC